MHTYFDLIQTSPYIENFGAIIGLVTSPRFVEISEFGHNFLNGYRSYDRWWKLSTYEEFVAMDLGLVTAPRLWLESFTHVNKSTPKDFSSVM